MGSTLGSQKGGQKAYFSAEWKSEFGIVKHMVCCTLSPQGDHEKRKEQVRKNIEHMPGQNNVFLCFFNGFEGLCPPWSLVATEPRGQNPGARIYIYIYIYILVWSCRFTSTNFEVGRNKRICDKVARLTFRMIF